MVGFKSIQSGNFLLKGQGHSSYFICINMMIIIKICSFFFLSGNLQKIIVSHFDPYFIVSPVILLLAVLKRLFCFGSLVILDVVCRYLSLFLSYINIKIGKNRC